MVIHDLRIGSVAIVPSEANPPSSVDADAELSSAIARQSLEPIARPAPSFLLLG
jgi:hypothetical protein